MAHAHGRFWIRRHPSFFRTLNNMPQVSRKDPQNQRLQDKESKRARGMSFKAPSLLISLQLSYRCALMCGMQTVCTSQYIALFLTILYRLKLKCDKIVPCSRSDVHPEISLSFSSRLAAASEEDVQLYVRMGVWLRAKELGMFHSSIQALCLYFDI